MFHSKGDARFPSRQKAAVSLGPSRDGRYIFPRGMPICLEVKEPRAHARILEMGAEAALVELRERFYLLEQGLGSPNKTPIMNRFSKREAYPTS